MDQHSARPAGTAFHKATLQVATLSARMAFHMGSLQCGGHPDPNLTCVKGLVVVMCCAALQVQDSLPAGG